MERQAFLAFKLNVGTTDNSINSTEQLFELYKRKLPLILDILREGIAEQVNNKSSAIEVEKIDNSATLMLND